jgi:uncharacterized membrane protein
MNQTKVSSKRHLAKTISYRVISTSIGFLVMWLATDSIKLGAAFGVAELLYKPIQYYIHERVWYRFIKFGIINNNPVKKPKKTILLPQIDPVQPEQPKIKRLTYTKKTN